MPYLIKTYWRLALLAVVCGTALALDDLFTRPLSFVSGITAGTLKQYQLAAFLLVITLLLARFIRREIIHGLLERRSGGEVPKLIGDISGTMIVFIGICVIMAWVFNKDITALVATGGAGLMIIGIALRDMLLAAFTGVLLNVERPFRVGDLVNINDKYIGYVELITWRVTVLQTISHDKLVIPNLTLANAVILNHAQPEPHSRRSLEVIIDYDTSVESAERILYAAVLAATDVKLVIPPSINARRMERDGVVYEVAFVIANYKEFRRCEHAVIRSILQCMRDADVTVSFPKSEVIHSKRRAHIADRSLDSFHLVQQCRLFRSLPDELCKKIANLLIEHHFLKNEVIVKAGERRFSLFLVGEGMAKRIQTNRDGSTLIEQHFIATEAFGKQALFACQLQSALVIAESDALVYELDNRALALLIGQSPDVINDFAQALAQQSWQDSHPGQAALDPDPAAIERLRNIYRGQIEASYGGYKPAEIKDNGQTPPLRIQKMDPAQPPGDTLLAKLETLNIVPAAILVLTGANAGKELALTKNLTTLGKPGLQAAVIAMSPHGYFISHAEGVSHPLINGKELGAQAQRLTDHDVIELAGVKMEFVLKS